MIGTEQILAKLGKQLSLLKLQAVQPSTWPAQGKKCEVIWDIWEGKKRRTGAKAFKGKKKKRAKGSEFFQVSMKFLSGKVPGSRKQFRITKQWQNCLQPNDHGIHSGHKSIPAFEYSILFLL